MKRRTRDISILSKKKHFKAYRGSVYILQIGRRYRFGITARNLGFNNELATGGCLQVSLTLLFQIKKGAILKV